MQLLNYLLFRQNVFHEIVSFDLLFALLFERISSLIQLAYGLVNVAEGSPADHLLDLEMTDLQSIKFGLLIEDFFDFFVLLMLTGLAHAFEGLLESHLHDLLLLLQIDLLVNRPNVLDVDYFVLPFVHQVEIVLGLLFRGICFHSRFNIFRVAHGVL